jgi:chemotaxis protein CheX
MLNTDEIVGLLRQSASDVFSTMLGLEVELGPSRTETSGPTVGDGVLAVVGVGGPLTGAGWFLCSATCARELCSRLLMTEVKAVDEEVLDAIGEITNMIVGSFKTALEERVGPLGLSIPTVIYGRNFTSRSVAQEAWTVQPLSCMGEALEIRVCLSPSKEAGAARHGFAHPAELLA